MPLFAARISPLRIALGVFVAALLSLTPSAAQAQEDPVAIEKITTLNKKALDAYNNLDFEDARKLLKQALDMCSSSGLDRHPIKARTHIHMGVVLIATKQQDLGVKQFRKALEIQPDIQVTKALANPEILQAFEEARSSSASAGASTDGGGEADSAPSGGKQEQTAPPGISHFPITRGKKGSAISIAVTVSPDLTGYTKVVLAYRGEGAEEFLARDMRRSGNRFVGEIPADATDGNLVQYYVDAEAEDETAVASAGSEERPFVISLKGGDEEDGDDGDDEEAGKFWVSLLGGSGFGYATGNGEVNADNKVNAGFAPSSAMQITPEVGYFLTPTFRLSLQFRYQIVSGTTPLNLRSVNRARAAEVPPGPMVDENRCGSDHLCSTANGAAAVIIRSTWFFGSDMWRPYFSLAAGVGQIRHVVKFTSIMANMKGLCGPDPGEQPCYDTVLSGPIFAGPGGGLMIKLTPMFSALVDVGTLLGFPKFTFHIDGNVGVAARF